MPDAEPIAIAKAAAAQLLAAAAAPDQDLFSQAITPEYKLLPSVELKDLEAVAVFVQPGGDRMSYRSRSSTLHDYPITISIRKHAAGGEATVEATAEEVIRLAQEIADYWRFRSLAGRQERLVAIESTEVGVESLRTQRVIGANVVLVFRGERE